MKAAPFSVFGLVALLVLLSGCAQPSTENGGGIGNQGQAGILGQIENQDLVDIGGGNGMAGETVEAGDKVSVDYRGSLEDGTVFDTSIGRAPLEFTVGAGQMIGGFDAAVIGMALNEEKTVTLEPGDAYGEANESRVTEVPKESVGGAESLEVGMVLTSSQGANGVVKEIKEDTVVIDFNHPLAGKRLTFWIKVMKIEKA